MKTYFQGRRSTERIVSDVLPGDNDTELIKRAWRGDTEAFALLLQRHRPTLVAVCRRMLTDASLVEDIAQEAALEAWLSLQSLEQPERFGSWLVGIGLNIGRSWLRRRSRETWLPEVLDGGRKSDEIPDEGASPEERAETRDLADRVRYAIASLPPGQRAAVTLFYLSGLSYLETATLLRIDVGTVRTRLHKARGTLKRKLFTLWEDNMATNMAPPPIPMQVVDVRRTQSNIQEAPKHVVVLQEINGSRTLRVWIGEAEAGALALNLKRVQYPRPGPYHLVANLVQIVGGQITEARISRLVDDTYYATVFVRGTGGINGLDARPSDALNLALLTQAPITVEPAVLVAAESAPQKPPNELQQAAQSVVGADEIVAEITAKWQK